METKFVREISVSYKGPRIKLHGQVRESKDVAALFRKFMPNNSKEHFMALYLGGSHEPIAYSVVTTGLATSTQVHPREVFQPGLICGAVAICVCHNHPSSDLTPSDEDKRVTVMLKDAAKVLGIKFLDHVIVTDENHFSFAENGHI